MTTPPRTVPAEPTETIERLWQNHLDRDDRNSPEEYPDMALITFEEFRDAILAAAAAPPPPEDRLLAEVVELMARAAGTLTAVGMWSDSPRFEQRAQELRDMVSRLRAAQQPTEEGGG